MDKITKEKRSENMSHIKGSDTTLEVKVRSFLFKKGFRFRKNDKRYPGKPDVVLPKYRTIIFINGCFWHNHQNPNCKIAHIPKTRPEYWMDKFEKNRNRDRRNIKNLEKAGWNVIVLWECELKNDFKGILEEVVSCLLSEEQKNN